VVSTSLKRIGKSTGDLGPLALSSRSALVNQPTIPSIWEMQK
jgi:hypothetical protein